jgi:beta-1,4-mannosyltransferase
MNGLVFSDALQLAEQFEVSGHGSSPEITLTAVQALLKDFPSSEKLHKLAKTLQVPHSKDNDTERWVWTSWEDNWDQLMKGLIQKDANT